MKNLIALLLLLASSLPLFAQGRFFNMYGAPANVAATSTYALDATASGGYSQDWFTTGWMPLATKTVSKIRILIAGVTLGTLGANDWVVDVYTESAGALGVSQMTSNTVTATPSGASAQWVESISFTCTVTCDVTAFTQYFIVVRNANGTPASNFPTIRYVTSLGPMVIDGEFNNALIRTSSNSGSTLTAVTSSSPIVRIEYSDNTFEGYPMESFTAHGSSGNNLKVNSAREVGVEFTLPANMKINVKGCAWLLGKGGTPTGNFRCRIYSDNGSTATLLDTSNVLTPAQVGASGARWSATYFTTAVTLSAGVKYRVVMAETTQSDSTSNYYAANAMIYENNANSLALLPYTGTLRGCYCASSCTTSANWTADPINIPFHGLLLDPAGEFASQGGGGQKGFAWIQ